MSEFSFFLFESNVTWLGTIFNVSFACWFMDFLYGSELFQICNFYCKIYYNENSVINKIKNV